MKSKRQHKQKQHHLLKAWQAQQEDAVREKLKIKKTPKDTNLDEQPADAPHCLIALCQIPPPVKKQRRHAA